jgi:hypothetical protein
MPPCSGAAGAAPSSCCGGGGVVARTGGEAACREERGGQGASCSSHSGDACGACGGAAVTDARAERFFSDEALAREPHSLRALAPLLAVRALGAPLRPAGAHSRSRRACAHLFHSHDSAKRKRQRQVPGIIWLAGGTPPASSFPFAKFTATLKDGSVIEMTPEEVRRAWNVTRVCVVARARSLVQRPTKVPFWRAAARAGLYASARRGCGAAARPAHRATPRRGRVARRRATRAALSFAPRAPAPVARRHTRATPTPTPTSRCLTSLPRARARPPRSRTSVSSTA